MEYIAVAFRSRADTLKFSELLKANKIYNEIINTPKQAGVGCGLSVKISMLQLNLVKIAIRKTHLPSFAGIFKIKMVAGKQIVNSI